MSYLLLDNCHHNHCCHGAYTETINTLIRQVNDLQNRVTNNELIIKSLQPKYTSVTIVFDNWVHEDTPGTFTVQNSEDKNVVVNIGLYNYIRGYIYDKEFANSDIYKNIHDSLSCCAKLSYKDKNNNDIETIYHKVQGNGGTGIGFTGSFYGMIANSSTYRLSLNKKEDYIDCSWYVPESDRDRWRDIDNYITKEKKLDVTIIYV